MCTKRYVLFFMYTFRRLCCHEGLAIAPRMLSIESHALGYTHLTLFYFLFITGAALLILIAYELNCNVFEGKGQMLLFTCFHRSYKGVDFILEMIMSLCCKNGVICYLLHGLVTEVQSLFAVEA